jgi:endonuclease III
MIIDIDYKNGIKSLLDGYKDVLNEEIREGLIWRYKIEKRRASYEDQQELLEDIIAQLLVQGRGAKGVETQINNIKEIIGQWSIENVEKNLDSMGMSARKIQKLTEILQYLKSNSISDWIIGLHEGNNHIPRMGLKSDDDFLKSHGFYEHIPVDRHTQRFLFRTGIIHWYLKRNNDDVLTLFAGAYEEKYKLFQKIIATFCKKFCDNVYIPIPNGELRLAENPGVLDIVIWRHCGEDENLGCRNICGNRPACNECVFKKTCLWYMLR